MSGSRDNAPSPGGAHYREMAEGLRKLARQCRLVGARKELLELAVNYDRRADHFDGLLPQPTRDPESNAG